MWKKYELVISGKVCASFCSSSGTDWSAIKCHWDFCPFRSLLFHCSSFLTCKWKHNDSSTNITVWVKPILFIQSQQVLPKQTQIIHSFRTHTLKYKVCFPEEMNRLFALNCQQCRHLNQITRQTSVQSKTHCWTSSVALARYRPNYVQNAPDIVRMLIFTDE